jgi:hypothetical protein
VSKFKKLLFGEDTSWISLEVSYFLKQKGIFEKMNDYNIIMVFFFSNEKPIFLMYYVSTIFFYY